MGQRLKGTVIGMVLIVAVAAISGCGGGGSSRVTAHGTVTLSEPIDSGGVTGDPTIASPGSGFDTCQGTDPYGDVAPGATVTVRDAGDKIVGLGQLGSAPPRIRYSDGSSKLESALPQNGAQGYDPALWTGTIVCSLPFSIRDVAGGSKFYTVEVAHRSRVTLPAGDLSHIALTVDS